MISSILRGNFSLASFINELIIFLPVLLISLTIHELCHGFTAYKLGDSTAKNDGRLSLNPIRHIDPLGMLCLIFAGFGWAKPVMVNPYRLKNPKRDMVLISAAGPASNFVLAFISLLIIFPKLIMFEGKIYLLTFSTIYSILFSLFSVNIMLGIFNLIPFPPLDGSKIFAGLLPKNIYYRLPNLGQLSMPILMILVLTGIFDLILTPMINGISTSMYSLVKLIYSPFM